MTALSLAVFLISLATALGHGHHGNSQSSDPFTCSIARYGKLVMFSNRPLEQTEQGNVEIPCKYIFAEMQCGNYKVKVTGGSVSDPQKIHRYSPDTAWVKVQKVDKPEKVFIARTDVGNFQEKKFVWNVKRDLTTFRPDHYCYNEERCGAIVSMDGVFEVFFSANRTLSVTCFDEQFTNTPYPESICGTPNADGNQQGTDRKELFKGMNKRTEKSYSLTYHILNNSRVTQSTQCTGIARKFQRCARDGFQAEAVARCARVFSDRSLSKCLNRIANRVNAFRLCIKFTGCNRDENVQTGPAKVCQFFQEQVDKRGCPDEMQEIRDEMKDCPQ